MKRKITPLTFMCLSDYEKQTIVAWLGMHGVDNWGDVKVIEECGSAGGVTLTFRDERRMSVLGLQRFPWPASLQTHR